MIKIYYCSLNNYTTSCINKIVQNLLYIILNKKYLEIGLHFLKLHNVVCIFYFY